MKALLRAGLTAATIGLAISSAHALPVCAPMDLDGDCKSDIVWRNIATGQNYIWLMNGLTIASQGNFSTVADPAWQIQGMGDFDGDGGADILWRHALTGENYIWLMNGLSITAQGQVNIVADPGWQVQGIGDFDGDGRADILWRNTVTGENYIFLMNGLSITAQGQINVQADQAWQVKGIGDFDGDGKADILWRNTSTGENYIFFMNGLTIAAQGGVNVVADQAWQVKGIGDFDGDGRADILWRNTVTGEDYIWLMNGLSITARGTINVQADQAWQVKGIGDFDGDGKADILWRNTVTGENHIFLMNGLTIASQGDLPGASPNWIPKSATTLADSTGPDTIAPSTPAGLTASAVSSSRIDLSWNAATDNVGVIRYGVYRDGVQIAYISGRSYANTRLAAATTYSYTVAAYDAAGNASAQSSAVSATTKAPADTQPPSIPANLAATVVSSSQINLSWSAATDNVGVTGYRVYRDGTLAASPGGTSASITGLSAGVPYSFTVSAFDAAGNVSAPSAALSVTTPAPGTSGTPALVPTPYSGTPIAVPGSFEAENFDLGGEGVAYHDKTPGNQGGRYRITEDVDIVMSYDALGGGYVVNNFETGEWLAYTINVAASTLYDIEIRASSAFANSAFHVEIDGQDVTGLIIVPNTGWWNAFQWVGKQGVPIATGKHVLKIFADQQYFNLNSIRVMAAADTQAPSVPENLRAIVVSSSQIDLAWSAATDNIGVTGYRVYRDGTRVASPGGTSASITGLSAGVPYSFTVSAFDAAGNVSAPSAPLSATTPPPLITPPSTPTGLAASALTPTSLTLSWSAAT